MELYAVEELLPV